MNDSSQGKKYVLVADDDAGIIRFVTAVIEGEGLEVLPARDGKQAYQLLKAGKPIVAAVVDIRMPYIEGSQIVKFMRSDAKLDSIPIIVTTGDHHANSFSGSVSAGAVAFLPKPFTNHQLRLLLRTLLGSKGEN